NGGLDFCPTLTRSSTTAVELRRMSESRRFSELIHDRVKTMVGTAASMMPRLPSRALESWPLTAASTVSYVGVSAVVVVAEASPADSSAAMRLPFRPHRGGRGRLLRGRGGVRRQIGRAHV